MPESALTTDPNAPAARPPDGWIAAAEAADVLGVTRQTILNRLKSASLAGNLVETASGPRWYVDPMSDPALARIYSPVKFRPGDGRRALEIDERRRKTAELRLLAVRSWQDYRDRIGQTADKAMAFGLWAADFAREQIKDKPICSYTTMWRWEQQATDGLAGLAPRHRGRSSGEPSKAAWAFFQSLWLTQQRRSIADCYRQTESESRANGWQWITEAACRRMVRTIPKAVVIERREGRKALEDKAIYYVERDYDLASNAWWVVDHHQLDVFCIGKDGRECCPWITYWQDVRSRKAVGVMLNDGPNTDVVLASLRRAVLDYGRPEHAYFDNGKDFRAREVTGGYRLFHYEPDKPHITGSVAHLGLAVHFAAPYNAKAKTNERTFRTTRMQFSQQWLSYRGRNTQDRPEHLAKMIAVARGENPKVRSDELALRKILDVYDRDKLLPHWDELESAIYEWFDKVYNQRPHAGRGINGQTPDECYAANLGEVVRIDEDELVILMMRSSGPRVVGQNGIRAFGQLYGFPQMMAMLGQKVYFRYDGRDISKLYIFTLKDELVAIATSNDRGQWGATREDLGRHMKLKAQGRKLVKAYVDNLEQVAGGVESVKRQRELAEQEAARRATAHRKPGQPSPDDDGEPAAAGTSRTRRLRIHRTRFAQAADDLRTGKIAVGISPQLPATTEQNGTIRLAGGEIVRGLTWTETLPTGDVVDRATGEVVVHELEHLPPPTPTPPTPPTPPTMDELSEALNRSLHGSRE